KGGGSREVSVRREKRLPWAVLGRKSESIKTPCHISTDLLRCSQNRQASAPENRRQRQRTRSPARPGRRDDLFRSAKNASWPEPGCSPTCRSERPTHSRTK